MAEYRQDMQFVSVFNKNVSVLPSLMQEAYAHIERKKSELLYLYSFLPIVYKSSLHRVSRLHVHCTCAELKFGVGVTFSFTFRQRMRRR